MPGAARKGDIGSAHLKCYPPSPAITGSGDVFINNLPAVRVGDAYALHGCNACPPHARKAAQGSATVNINGQPAVRIGDAIDCGGVASTGSSNVFIGEGSWSGKAFEPLKAMVRFQLSKYPGSVHRVRRQEPYKLYKNGGLVQQGLVDDEGLIHYEYDLPADAEHYEIEIENQRLSIAIQALAPSETEQGAKQRLAALGYHSFDDSGANAYINATGNAQVNWLQGDNPLEASGTLTEPTTTRIKGLLP